VHHVVGYHAPTIPFRCQTRAYFMDGNIPDCFHSFKNIAAMAAQFQIFLNTETNIVGVNTIEQCINNLLGTNRSIYLQRLLPPLPRC
jgi:hypothetical protein